VNDDAAAGPDDELLAELAAMFDRLDPVPPEVTDFARAALGWRRLDSELAELLEDSLLETAASARTRAGTGSRWLTFRAAELAIALELTADEGKRLALGQLVPGTPEGSVEVQDETGEAIATAEADSLGRFRLEFTPRGRVRLRVVLPDRAAPVETSWFVP
jgi:hypothetical protein